MLVFAKQTTESISYLFRSEVIGGHHPNMVFKFMLCRYSTLQADTSYGATQGIQLSVYVPLPKRSNIDRLVLVATKKA